MAVDLSTPKLNQDLGNGGTGGGARASGPDAGPPSSLLEHSQNVVTVDEGGNRVFQISKCGCDCWYCSDCCERKGYNLRAELIPVLKTFTGLMMLTLTIDPELFASPKEAYLYVREQRALSRLMRDLDRAGHLHSRRYFYVVECQRDTEQVHFHVLIDATFIPKEAIDASWSKMRPKSAGPPSANRPTFGMTRFSKSRFDGGPEHAGRYATKYLVKTPEYGWPAWVLAMGKDRRLPRYGTSRGFWGRLPQPSNPTGNTREKNPRTYADRVAECGSSCNLFETRETIDEFTGTVEEHTHWLARLAVEDCLISVIAPEQPAGSRVILIANGVHSCIKALSEAAGHPIAVISGLGAGGRRK